MKKFKEEINFIKIGPHVRDVEHCTYHRDVVPKKKTTTFIGIYITFLYYKFE